MARRPAPLPPALVTTPHHGARAGHPPRAGHDDGRPAHLNRPGPRADVRTVAELRAAGVTRARTRASDLDSLGRGIRASAGLPVDRLDHLRAVLAVTPGKPVVSHATAAWLWGMWVPGPLEEPILHLSVRRDDGGRPRRAGVRTHWLSPRATTTVLAGVPVTSPPWTWTDLATQLVPWGRPERVPEHVERRALEDVVVAGESLLQTPHGAAGRTEPGEHPRCAVEELAVAVGKRANVRGVRLLRAALPMLRPGSGSPAETRLRVRLVAAGAPEPEPNGRVVLEDGSWVMPDLVWRAARVCLEYEGDHHRTDAAQFRRDISRVRRLEAEGWACLRVTAEVWHEPGFAAVLADLRAAFARRGCAW